MSFAEQLGRTTKLAQDSFLDESLKCLEEFKELCQLEAANGNCSCSAQFNKPRFFYAHLPTLKRKLEEMGFQSCNIYHSSETWIIQIGATWKIESPEPKRRRKEPTGSSNTCPVCLEHRPVVALTPCGHVVCKQCQQSQQFRECPMCRESVTGATKALFLWVTASRVEIAGDHGK